MRTIQLLTATAAILATATAAGAQQIQSPYRFVEERQSGEVFVGSIFSDRGSLELGPEGGTVFGIRYTLQLGGPFVLDAEVGYLPSSRYVFEVDSTAPDTVSTPERSRVGEADIAVATALVGLRVNLTGPRTWNSLQPYVLIGGGLAVEASGTAAEDEALQPTERFDFGTSFAGHLGAGVEWYVQRHVGLRAEFRDVLWQVETPDAFLGEHTPSDEWVQNPMISLGLAIHF